MRYEGPLRRIPPVLSMDEARAAAEHELAVYAETGAGTPAVAEMGTCALCGQEMIRTGDDCWHPHTITKACPPEPSSVPWDAEGWAAFRAAGLDHGRPGREHFRPVVPE